jgi:F-type H+-transporting ATPase subunit b
VSGRPTARRLVALGGSAAALALFLPVLAAAAQGPEAPSTAEWVYRWLNFALVFGVGGWFAGRKLKAAFRRNAEKIAATIAEAEEAKRQAAERLQAAEAKLTAVDREAEEMRERARRDSAAEAERIRALAREEAARAERAADAEIEAAERTVVNRLREMAIDKTIERARALVAERMTPAIDRRLFSRFVAALGRAGREA